MDKRYWSSRFGFYLVAAGSACGIGNLWRFPYIVGENGGGAFILFYLLLVLILGLPMLVAELMLGKKTRKSVLMASQLLAEAHSKPSFIWAGRFSLILSFIVLSYYSVISGWVLHYLIQFLMAALQIKIISSDTLLIFLLDHGFLQVALASAHILITMLVVSQGIEKGLEKWMSYIFPTFVILLAILMYQSLSLPTAPETLRFLFYPDFSKLNLSSLGSALGHVLFTLSLGFGTMVTFGSYLKNEDHIPSAAIRVSVVDTLISIFAVVLVFSVIMGGRTTAGLTEPVLLFEAVPRYFLQVKGGVIFGTAFFTCLYMSALNASIGIFETLVSNATERAPKKFTRKNISLAICVIAIGVAILPALSSSVFRGVMFKGRSLLEFIDWLMISWLLPIIALILTSIVASGVTRRDKEALFVDKEKSYSFALFSHWDFALSWLIPFVIIFALVLQTLDLFV